MSAYFVTSTGTDIGKTFVTAGLIRALRGRGVTASALKPIVSGFDLATAAVSDPGVLLDAMGEPITDETLNRIAPWRFAAPLSPDMAAAREGKAIPYAAMIDFCRSAIAENGGTLFVEGVGGVMVPLDTRHTVLDWMDALELPVILVAGGYLGTISHTLTALDVLVRHRRKVACVVVNSGPADPVSAGETIQALRRFAPRTPMVSIPRVMAWHEARSEFADLAAML